MRIMTLMTMTMMTRKGDMSAHPAKWTRKLEPVAGKAAGPRSGASESSHPARE